MRETFMAVTISILLIVSAYAQKGGGEMKLTSPAFGHNEMIPKKYTCQGDDISPPLTIKNIPAETKNLALVIDDPDAPMGTWDHWIVYNIDPAEEIKENSIPGVEGHNSFGRLHYGGPCPPSGTHRYFHKIYALDEKMDLPEGISKSQLENKMQDHILDQAELIGLYRKN